MDKAPTSLNLDILEQIIKVSRFDRASDLAALAVNKASLNTVRRRCAHEPSLWNSCFLMNPKTRAAEQAIQDWVSGRVPAGTLEDPSAAQAPYIDLQYPGLADQHLPLIVEKFPNLLKIRISPPCKIKNLRPLLNLPNLKSLSVHPNNCAAEEIGLFSHIQSLTVQSCFELELLDPHHEFELIQAVEHMSQLRELCLGPTSINHNFAELNHLEHLHVSIGKTNRILDLDPITKLKNLNTLIIYIMDLDLPDDTFAPLAKITNLHTLHIMIQEFDSAHFKHISQCKNLRHLDIECAQRWSLDNADLRNLENLQTLKLERAYIPINDLMASLKGCRQLQSLTFGPVEFWQPFDTVNSSRIKLPTLRHLGVKRGPYTLDYEMQKIEHLTIGYTIDVSPKVAKNVKRLDCIRVHEDLNLSMFKNLKSLDLGEVKDSEIFHKLETLNQLKCLRFHTWCLSRLRLPRLGSLTNLEELYVENYHRPHNNVVGSNQFWEDVCFPNLKILSIHDAFPSNYGVRTTTACKLKLKNFPNLEYLSWSRCLEEGFDWRQHVEPGPSGRLPLVGYRWER